MEKVTFTSNSKFKAFSAFIVALLLLICSEQFCMPFFIERTKPYFDGFELPIWNKKLKLVTTPNSIDADVLILGDSQGLGGINAKTVSNETGLTTYNLALPGLAPTGNYFLLKRYLETHKKPKVLFYQLSTVAFTYNDWTDYFFINRTIRWFLDFSELQTLYPVLDKSEESTSKVLAQFVLGKVFPSTRFRKELKQILLDWFLNKLPTRRQATAEIEGELDSNNGFRYWRELNNVMGVPTAPYANYVKENPEVVHTPMFEIYKCFYVFNPTWLNIYFAEQVFSLASELDIPIIVFFVPEPEALSKERYELGYTALAEAFFTSLFFKHRNLHILKTLPKVYPETFFEDLMHLNEAGAKTFTEDFIEAIADENIVTISNRN